jgi:hypothetical protein
MKQLRQIWQSVKASLLSLISFFRTKCCLKNAVSLVSDDTAFDEHSTVKSFGTGSPFTSFYNKPSQACSLLTTTVARKISFVNADSTPYAT